MKLSRFVLIAALALGTRASGAEPIKIRVYHTNDVHGWIMSRPDKFQTNRLIGGAAALASLIGREAGPKLVLDAGDWWQGTPEGNLTKGEAVADVFNAIGYDAIVVGNHEYDAGADVLRALIGKMKMPVLSANTYGADNKLVPWVQPWIVKEVAGVKIGIFGLTTSNMHRLAFPKNILGLDFRREVDAARDAVKALKKQGATVIIAVTHMGVEGENQKFEGDQTLAREVPGIDLIVGGHSHTFLNRPIRGENGTLIVQAGSYLVKAGRAVLEIDPQTKKVVASSDELLDLWPDRVGEDPAVKAIVARHSEAVGKIFETVIATAPALMGREPDRENALGDWMADCYRESLGVDVALQNGGGIRAEIPAGPVTLRSIFGVMPFDNLMVKLVLKGSDLRKALDHGVGMAKVAQFSGASVEYYRPKPAGERLASVAVGGAPLDDAKTYSLATLDFLLDGGDGYSVFDRFVSSEPTGALARDLLNECARKQGAMSAPAAGRLKLREN
ncbi:MAG: bifunctional UDP-sugar hydrolase/5'-nucleotidase [Elusimicrobia bacterium]|nr:bifunctional UDP-sugar hydrolase/5'-nucleotidase [Elusimicrobiota bacterium]